MSESFLPYLPYSLPHSVAFQLYKKLLAFFDLFKLRFRYCKWKAPIYARNTTVNLDSKQLSKEVVMLKVGTARNT